MKQTIIQTERLVLRALRDTDAPTVKKLAGNPNVSKTTRNIPFPYEDGMAESWIESTRAANTGKSLAYAIELKEEGILIGSIGLMEINNSQAELGYWIGEQYWANGYCTEATKALIKFAFESLELNKVIAEYLTSNVASGKVMEKSGMSYIGTTRKECRPGEVDSVETYEINNSKYN